MTTNRVESCDHATVAACSKKRHRRKSSIQFCEYVEVFPTIHALDYTLAELVASWYDRNDLKTFKSDRAETGRRIDSGECLESDCVHGVESHTIEGFRIRRENILAGVNSVLNEQDLQDLDDCENQDMIAHIYRINTARCEQSARKRARALAREVQE